MLGRRAASVMSSPPRPELAWTLAVGARRGRYEVIAPIGRGGYAQR
jgi:hypothetical protein